MGTYSESATAIANKYSEIEPKYQEISKVCKDILSNSSSSAITSLVEDIENCVTVKSSVKTNVSNFCQALNAMESYEQAKEAQKTYEASAAQATAAEDEESANQFSSLANRYQSVVKEFANRIKKLIASINSVKTTDVSKKTYTENPNTEQILENIKTIDAKSIIITTASTTFVHDTLDNMLTMMKDIRMNATDVSQDGASTGNTGNGTTTTKGTNTPTSTSTTASPSTPTSTSSVPSSSSKKDEQEKIASDIITATLNNELGNTASYYGYNDEWCAMYAWDNAQKIAKQLGVNLNKPAAYASTGHTMEYFRDTEGLELQIKHNGQIDYTPKPGDFVFIDNDGDANEINWTGFGIQEHTAMVVDYNPETRMIKTIEGNWGSKVSENERSLDSGKVIGFGSYYGN